MKKFIATFLCATLILLATPLNIMAEDASVTVLSTGTVSAFPGDNISVTFNISENAGFSETDIVISLDTDVLSFASRDAVVIGGDYRDCFSVSANLFGLDGATAPEGTGIITLAPSTTSHGDVKITGDFLTLNLVVSDIAPGGSYDITLSAQNALSTGDTLPEFNFSSTTVVVADVPRVIGAEIRIPATGEKDVKQGLRFTSRISKELVSAITSADMPDSVGFGSIVIPTCYAEGEITKDYAYDRDGVYVKAAVVPAAKVFREYETEIDFTVCVTDIGDHYYTEEYTVVPYITYMDGDVETTIYGTGYSVCVFEIAKCVYNDKNTTERIKEEVYKLLTAVDPQTYPKKPSWTGIYRP